MSFRGKRIKTTSQLLIMFLNSKELVRKTEQEKLRLKMGQLSNTMSLSVVATEVQYAARSHGMNSS